MAALKRHSLFCNVVTVADEDSSDEEDIESTEQVHIQEEAPLTKIYDMVQNSTFEEAED